MKAIRKITTLCCALLLFTGLLPAQNETASISKPTAATEEPTVSTPSSTITIMLKNEAEKSVPVFAGPKEEIRDPKIKVVGGLSKNTLYLKANDAVCLMTDDKRPVACTIIKPGVTVVEINVSANGISSK